MLFITPRIVTDSVDVTRAIEDLRRKMERLDSVFPPASNKVSGNPDNRSFLRVAGLQHATRAGRRHSCEIDDEFRNGYALFRFAPRGFANRLPLCQRVAERAERINRMFCDDSGALSTQHRRQTTTTSSALPR